jgi:predicted DNA-binding transcriptional regulator AlpA
MNSDRILRPKEVAEKLGISITTLNRYATRPDFPKKVSLSPRHTGYYEHELKAYLETFTQNKEVNK